MLACCDPRIVTVALGTEDKAVRLRPASLPQAATVPEESLHGEEGNQAMCGFRRNPVHRRTPEPQCFVELWS